MCIYLPQNVVRGKAVVVNNMTIANRSKSSKVVRNLSYPLCVRNIIDIWELSVMTWDE